MSVDKELNMQIKQSARNVSEKVLKVIDENQVRKEDAKKQTTEKKK